MLPRPSIAEQAAVVNRKLSELQQTHCLRDAIVSSLIKAMNIACEGDLEQALAQIDRVNPEMYEDVIGQQIARVTSPIRRIDKKRMAIDEFRKIPAQERIQSLRETLKDTVRSMVEFLNS